MNKKNVQKNGLVLGDANANCNVFNNCSINTSTDKCIELLQDGELEEAQTLLSGTLNALSSQHPLFPKYGYNINSSNGKVTLSSEPLSQEALKEYPPKIVGKCMIKVGDKDSVDVDDIEQYSYRNQEPIIINILDATKLLGDIIDPSQWDIEKYIGKVHVIPPQPFPPADPCILLVNDIIVYDYILLRTERIIDDFTFVFSNYEQEDSDLEICFTVDVRNTSTDFKVNINPSGNESLLKYVEFMSMFGTNTKLTIQVLPSHGVFFEGYIKDINYTCAFENIEDEIQFLRNIVFLEDRFNKKINIPSEIFQDDMNTISYLINVLNGTGHEGDWNEAEFEMKLTPENRDMLLEKDNIPMIISFLIDISVNLFDDVFSISKMRRTFQKAYFKNLNKVKKLVEVLDVGDKIKIELVPVDGGLGEMIDYIDNKNNSIN